MQRILSFINRFATVSLLRLFAPLYLLLAVYLFLYEIIIFSLVGEFSERTERDELASYLSVAFAMAEKLAVDSDDYFALEQEVNENAGLQLFFVHEDELNFPPEIAAKLDAMDTWVEDTESILVYKRLVNSDYYMRIGPVAPQWKMWNLVDWVEALIKLVFISLIGMWAWWVHGKLKALSRAAEDFGSGNFDARAPSALGQQVGGLNEQFNQMAGQLQQLISSHKELTSAVSHELRTPIARMKFTVELLRDSELSAEVMEYVESMAGDIGEQEALVDELLTYAKFEKLSESMHFPQHLLDSWLRHWLCYSKFNTNIAISIDCAPDIKLRFADEHLARALDNLMLNGIRYAQNKINISVGLSGDFCRLYVDDDGPGIDSSMWLSIFDAFVREETSRNKNHGGFGLGLAIVKRIMLWHGGKVSVCESPIGGARFILDFPLNEHHQSKGEHE